ncbi:hypothetical protein [Streptomyces sp. NBC_00986]|uniref:hypothetical protein n=1 Tax=Streptomyces sp. NBC_00986 TaxID=2903702 RepID=UPI00386DC96B|nr:hypothetical protein OG504_45230 [Streptomyces sp. NBC_00986]
MNRRQQLDDEIAAMLRAGATHQHIVNTLHVGHVRVVRVRAERRIPLPASRNGLTPAERRAREEQATAMLRAGATYQQIYDATRLQYDRISALRKHHNIPVPNRRPNRPTTAGTPAPTHDLDALYDAIFHPGATP